jgi:nucleotide-binding universal stress UspA family protein
MYKRIVLAVDLAESESAPKGLPQAVELAKASGGEVRLVNVQPVIPATFMEYVPVDFDEEQEKRAKAELDALLAGVDLPAERKSAATRAGGIYHELLEEASSRHVGLSARLERHDDRAPRAMFGAGGQRVTSPPA